MWNAIGKTRPFLGPSDTFTLSASGRFCLSMGKKIPFVMACAQIDNAFPQKDSCEIIFPKQSGIPSDFLNHAFTNNCIYLIPRKNLTRLILALFLLYSVVRAT
jgi:hypothetical protein